MRIKNFIESPECLSRAHCRACLVDPTWRESIGAPAVCPHGVTAAKPLPSPVTLPPIVGGCCGGATTPADTQAALLRQHGAIE